MADVPLPKVDYDAGWHRQYTADQMHAHAAAVSAAKDAEIETHRQAQAAVYMALGSGNPDRTAWPDEIRALRERVRVLEDALRAMLTHMGMDEDEWNKPTEDMLDKGAMEIAMNNQRVMPAEHKAEHVYRAMIAASPAAPAASVVPQPAQRTADCLMCGHCAATGERVAKPAVPLTDEQIRSMWKSSEFRGNGGQADWFCEGIRAAEAHHGITGASK